MWVTRPGPSNPPMVIGQIASPLPSGTNSGTPIAICPDTRSPLRKIQTIGISTIHVTVPPW
jgi:hypothetical protein